MAIRRPSRKPRLGDPRCVDRSRVGRSLHGRRPSMDIVSTAKRLADEVLFPAALATDTADTLPVELLDALAEAGLYGLSGPPSARGIGANFPTVCRVLASLA